MIPANLRQGSLKESVNEILNEQMNVQTLEGAWLSDDEFVLDPTRITLFTGHSGLDGDTFKVKWLMDKYGVQINKTSRNSVLFMTNIGTTRSSCVFLRSCIRHCAQELEMRRLLSSRRELEELQQQINKVVCDCPALPDFSGFHPAFAQAQREAAIGYKAPEEQRYASAPHAPGLLDKSPASDADDDEGDCSAYIRDGDVREPFYLSYDEEHVEYFTLDEAIARIREGNMLVGSTFIIPYPPGFPIAVPGQILSEAIVEYMIKIDVKEIHGFDAHLGLRCFKDSLLRNMMQARGIPLTDCMLRQEQEDMKTSVPSPSSTSVPPVSVASTG